MIQAFMLLMPKFWPDRLNVPAEIETLQTSNVFPSFYCPTVVNQSLTFLFPADRSDTQHALLLQPIFFFIFFYCTFLGCNEWLLQ